MALAINGTNLTLQLSISFFEMSQFWALNIADQNGNPLVGPVPLITGAYPAGNILAPYQYMNIGSAFVINASGVASPDFPNSTDLGSDFLLLWDDNTAYVAGQPFGVEVTGPVGPPGPPGPAGPGFGGFVFMGNNGNLTPVLGANATQVAGTNPSSLALSGAAAIQTPSSPTPGFIFLIWLRQPSGGGYNVTFSSFYKGLSTFALDTTGNTQAILMFQVDPLGANANLLQVVLNGDPIS